MPFLKVGYLAALALFAAAPAVAQTVRDPADTLSMHLRTLAANPRDYAALLGAGQSALEVGDPNAALGFFARAEEIAPRDGRAKAGIGSALVMMERPDDALRLFGEAVSLGTPEELVARDRGLAYDLRGDNRRAQKDYALALKRGPDDEATRRYALSLGISGDRAQALTLLDPLLRKKDQGAWRARAFVMAMTGDVNGADSIARAVMPANMAGTMTPFLKRLASLNAADRAHAVNFGTMPSTGQSFAAVALGDPYKPAGTQTASVGDTLIPAGEPLGPRASDATPARVVEPLSRAPRRRPGQPVETASTTPAPGFTVPLAQPAMARTGALSSGPLPTARVGERIGTRVGPVDPARLPPEARGQGAAIASVTRGDLPPPSG
ncbi:MAG: SPOR domain-containing protein, partial [Sphingomonadaceae bacterium]|nr:SPOR domain-containing protein [Sphingomonadaceae bacterium]